VFKLLAACLHLSNISFALDDSDPAATATAAAAANISPQRLSFLRGSSGSGSAFFSGSSSSGNASTIITASNSTDTAPAGVSYGVVSGGSPGGSAGGVSPLGGSSGPTSMHRKFSFSGMLARRSKGDASSSTTAAPTTATATAAAAIGPAVIVNSRGPLELAASLLGVKAAELEKVLLSPGAGGDVRAAIR
jgi:hypothetical protein